MRYTPGRPPADHIWEDARGAWAHAATGKDLDAAAHARFIRSKKLECMVKLYWEKGGREHRLARYTKNESPNQNS